MSGERRKEESLRQQQKRCDLRVSEEYTAYHFLRLARRFKRSPSASQRLALTNWTTLTNCLNSMTGAEMPVTTQGQKLSILLARAISRAPALQGLAKRLLGTGLAGFPGCTEEGWASPTGWRSDGDRIGEEKESR